MSMPLPPSRFEFPDPRHSADPDGLVAVGGDLHPSTLLAAYRQGLFPWFNPGEPILWWSPDPRCIMRPGDFHPSKSLRRRARSSPYQLSIDQAFAEVVHQCAAPRAYADGTWISADIQQGYQGLHRAGLAHSLEVWEGDELLGGLYGVQLGRGFFGESMFSRRSDVSKLAFWLLMQLAVFFEFPLVDCQLPNDHLMSLGAVTLPRGQFLDQLQDLLQAAPPDWSALTARRFDGRLLAENPAAADLIQAILQQAQGT